MGDRHPALARLDVLVGRWTMRAHVEGLDGGAGGSVWTEFSWQDDGLFLRQFANSDPPPAESPHEWMRHAPFPTTCLIGLDDASGGFTQLYADARGVHRVYRMSFDGRVWKLWRDAPGFNQRFTGTLSEDGDTIEGQWEASDDGVDWKVDFGLTFSRVR
jgi:hypothetical protein